MKEIKVIVPEGFFWYAEDKRGYAFLYMTQPEIRKTYFYDTSNSVGWHHLIGDIGKNFHWINSLTPVTPGEELWIEVEE